MDFAIRKRYSNVSQVGSIKWTAGAEKGREIKRGDELGYFAYGGSTCVVLFPKGLIQCE